MASPFRIFKINQPSFRDYFALFPAILLNYNKFQSTGMALLDIDKAFDSVWHKGLLFKLHRYNYPLFLTSVQRL